jgi:hypothetical protein
MYIDIIFHLSKFGSDLHSFILQSGWKFKRSSS